jgi:hypothetical protein
MMIALARNAAIVASVRLWAIRVKECTHVIFWTAAPPPQRDRRDRHACVCASDRPVALGFDFLRRRLAPQPSRSLAMVSSWSSINSSGVAIGLLICAWRASASRLAANATLENGTRHSRSVRL